MYRAQRHTFRWAGELFKSYANDQQKSHSEIRDGGHGGGGGGDLIPATLRTQMKQGELNEARPNRRSGATVTPRWEANYKNTGKRLPGSPGNHGDRRPPPPLHIPLFLTDPPSLLFLARLEGRRLVLHLHHHHLCRDSDGGRSGAMTSYVFIKPMVLNLKWCLCNQEMCVWLCVCVCVCVCVYYLEDIVKNKHVKEMFIRFIYLFSFGKKTLK